MNYQQTLDYLYGNLPMYQRIGQSAIKKDLTNIRRLCDHLGNPEKGFKSVHIAGTNGKGSSAHMLAAILQSAGFKTGLYTSPHLRSFTERIRINGRQVPQAKVVEFVVDNKPYLEEVKPSFFEMTVAMAFDYFSKEEVDIAIIEVGLGGRLDSTNIITPEVCLITSIGMDHQNLLGNTMPEIAREKAGIMKRNVPVVIGNMQKEIIPVFVNHAKLIEAPIFFSGISHRFEIIEEFRGGKLHIRNKADKTTFGLDLLGTYQLLNLPGVFKTVEILVERGFPINFHQIANGLENVVQMTGLKGRWQRLSENPRIICDTGHNVDAIREILKQINSLKYDELFMIIGMVNDKDIEPMLKLLPSNAFYYFCQPNVPRAMKAQELADTAKKYRLKGKVVENVNEALGTAKKNAGVNDLIFIGGSTFVVAEIKDL